MPTRYPGAGNYPAALVADAQIIGPPQLRDPDHVGSWARSLIYRTPDTWQSEAWGFYHSLGELRQGASWKAHMMSRVRLRAAQRKAGQDEPEIIDKGPAAEAVADLAGGVGGQSRLMSSFAVHLDVPGECYLVGEVKQSGREDWSVRSIEEVRPEPGTARTRTLGASFQVIEWANTWRTLPPDSLVVRVWRPDEQYHWVADSPCRASRSLLRELELINRYIAAQYLSRLSSTGMVIFPEEVTIAVGEEQSSNWADFVEMWIDIASTAISQPGSAAAMVPIPIKVPGEYVDKIQHIDFTLRLDERIVDKRNACLARLAISLDMPPEALLGTSDVNHWNAWLIDEQGVKIHVAPTAEYVCDSLTVGYLHPKLLAGGMDEAEADEWVVWYDASELVLRPDRSDAAMGVYKLGELTGEALRRETGFDEADMPDDAELEKIILKQQALGQPANSPAALDKLMGREPEPAAVPTGTAAPSGGAPEAETPPTGQQGPPQGPPKNPPGSQGPETPPSTALRPDMTEELRAAARALHLVRIAGPKMKGGNVLLHPPSCASILTICPVGQARSPSILPGQPGYYECRMSVEGGAHKVLQGPPPNAVNYGDWIPTPLGSLNGH